MKARDGATSDRDKAEREDLAREDWPGSVNESGQRRKLQRRMDRDHTQAEQHNNTELHKSREIITRSEQHPDRQRTRQESITDHHDGERRGRKREDRSQR